MQQRRPRLGDVLDDYCPRERRVTNHVVVAMIEDDVKQTRCSTCDAEHDYKQARVPSDDTATPAWTIVNLAASYKLRLGESDSLAFVKLNNVGNSLAYNASTIGTVRPLSPLPGRALMAGVRVDF